MPPRRSWGEKAAPFVWPVWRRGKPEWQIVDLQTYIDEGFNANSLIYSAVMYKVRAMTAAPLRAYSGDRDNPEPLDEGHELAKLLARPNPHQSWEEFHGLNIVYLNIAGNCYIAMDRPRGGGLPEAMYTLRPDRTYIVPDAKKGSGLQGFLYVPEGKPWTEGTPFLPEDLMHVKLPAPGDPLEGMGYGLSPVSSLAKTADVDNMVTSFLQLFFQRGAMLAGYLRYDVPMDDVMASRVQERWMEKYGGYEKWPDIAVLDQGGEYRPAQATFEQMGLERIDERSEARILGPFGVPPILIGSRMGLHRATYANYAEARRHYWEDTQLAENRLFEVEYRYFLQEEGSDEWVAFDYSQVPALRQDIAEQAKAFADMVMHAVPPNEAIRAVGLPIEDIPGGDVSYIPMNLIPMGSSLPRTQPQGAGASAEEEQRTEGKKKETA